MSKKKDIQFFELDTVRDYLLSCSDLTESQKEVIRLIDKSNNWVEHECPDVLDMTAP